MREIGIGLLGVGIVGGGVLKIYDQHRADLEARAGCGLRIVAVVARDVAAPREGLEPAAWPLSTDPDRVLADPAVSLVVEVIGGLEPARTYVLRALEAGKHVVTANKALLATHGTELFEAARRRGVLLGFEAAVAGGVPIIGALRDGLAANRILSLQGIVNGTVELHPDQDDGRGARLRRGAPRGPGGGLRGGGSDARHRGHRLRAQAPDPRLARLPDPGGPQGHLHGGHRPAGGDRDRLRARARVPGQAPRDREDDRRRARGPRAPDADPGRLAPRRRLRARSTRSW